MIYLVVSLLILCKVIGVDGSDAAAIRINVPLSKLERTINDINIYLTLDVYIKTKYILIWPWIFFQRLIFGHQMSNIILTGNWASVKRCWVNGSHVEVDGILLCTWCTMMTSWCQVLPLRVHHYVCNNKTKGRSTIGNSWSKWKWLISVVVWRLENWNTKIHT